MLNLYRSLLLLFLLNGLSLLAQESYDSLLKSIDDELLEYEKTATQTKKNEHYQPYIVSVLDGETLVKLGVVTLEDALRLISGVDISSDNLNYRTPIFRGSNPTAYGQSKLFIDDMLVNNIFFDGYSEYLDMPIELIKRIEVIRGPGNEANEISSYAGSIHVVTYAEDGSGDMVFAKVGSNNFFTGGFRKGYKNGDFSLYSDLYYQKDDKSVHSNSDALKSGIFNYQTPFYTIDNSDLSVATEVPLWLKNYSFGLSMHYKDISFKGRLYRYEHGSAFGFNYIVPQDDDFLKFPNHYAEISYTKKYEKFKIHVKGGIKYNGIKAKTKLSSNGVELPKSSDITKTVIFPDGIYGEHKAIQRSLYHGVDIDYNAIKDHQVSVGYYISKIETTDVVSKITNRDTGKGLVDYTDTLPFFDKDASRDTYIFKVEDKYSYSDSLQFLTSINYENNTHIDAQIDPKISMVYRTKDDNIFKLLFATSHRTPSWQELYTLNNRARVGNMDLKAEKIHTFEAAHIKHFSHDSYMQSTLFCLINENQIHNITENNQYINSTKDNHLYGIELEYKGKITPKDSLYLSLSYIDGENSYDKTLSQISHILLKGYYIYNLWENLSLSTVARYNSSKDRVSYDDRSEIDCLTIFDTTLSYKNQRDDYRVSFGVKNIFDKDSIYASKPYTYEDDYPAVGRSFTLSFSKEF